MPVWRGFCDGVFAFVCVCARVRVHVCVCSRVCTCVLCVVVCGVLIQVDVSLTFRNSPSESLPSKRKPVPRVLPTSASHTPFISSFTVRDTTICTFSCVCALCVCVCVCVRARACFLVRLFACLVHLMLNHHLPLPRLGQWGGLL